MMTLKRKAPRCYVTPGSVAAGDTGRACQAAPLVRLPTRGRAERPSLIRHKGAKVTTTYHGGTRIDQAQAKLDRHAVSSGDGLCIECKVLGPCEEYEAAAMVFALSTRLPLRRPGATRPELMGAKRVDFNWLGVSGTRKADTISVHSAKRQMRD